MPFENPGDAGSDVLTRGKGGPSVKMGGKGSFTACIPSVVPLSGSVIASQSIDNFLDTFYNV